jgi:DNA invertase Pin-like site-specific DNA recombinase
MRIIIEHKYSSSHQNSAAIVKKEKRVFVSIFANQERNIKILRTHPRLTRKFKQEEKKGGSPVIRKKRRELKIKTLIRTGKVF